MPHTTESIRKYRKLTNNIQLFKYKLLYHWLFKANSARLFKSFLMGGFESASHINGSLQRLDMIAATQHDIQVKSDYAMLREHGIQTVRDGIRWPLIERDGQFDFASLKPMVDTARDQGTQVIWTLCHYGWPDDLDVFSPEFVTRFADYCSHVARFIKERTETIPFYTPINEISFLSWAAGEVGYIYPFVRHRGGELKRQLVKAALAGMAAILAVDDRARFVHVEPLINIIAPASQKRLGYEAAKHHNYQFEAWDMLAGLQHPEMGGDMRYLDIVGCNFYNDNQWEHLGQRLIWSDCPRDKRWQPLHKMMYSVYQRYQCPLIVGETSHVGSWRTTWMQEITYEIACLRYRGVPIEGVCLYPIIDRPDWDRPDHWHNSGLWDIEIQPDGNMKRILYAEYALQIYTAQKIFKNF